MTQLEDDTPEQREALERLLELNSQLLEKAEQLEAALESRIVIEQAKGVLMARYHVDPGKAFDALRHAARANRVRLRELAGRVVTEETTPTEVERYL